MAAADCLLNCLREVRLERFHRNFTERGLTNCEQLASLLVDDYSRFGVMSADDRRRLFQLIHIIKSVQADGIHCQHGAAGIIASQSNRVQQQTKPSIPVTNAVQRKEEMPDVTRNVTVQVQKVATAGDNTKSRECPAAPSRQFIKPIVNDCNYRVQYEQRPETMRLHITQETKVIAKNLATAADNSCGTPVFNCRKTLNFSDCDSCSDGADTKYFQQPAPSDTSMKPKIQSHGNDSGTFSSPAAKSSGLRPPPVVMTCISSPRAFVVPAGNRPIMQQHSSESGVSQTESQTYNHDQQASQKVTWTGQPMKSRHHAYFPAEKILPSEEPETHIERIYHSSGYNYGVPGSTVHSNDKVSVLIFNLII